MASSNQFDDFLMNIHYFKTVERNVDLDCQDNKNVCYEALMFQYEGEPFNILNADGIEFIFDHPNNHGIAIKKEGAKSLTIVDLMNIYESISKVKGGIKKEEENCMHNKNINVGKEGDLLPPISFNKSPSNNKIREGDNGEETLFHLNASKEKKIKNKKTRTLKKKMKNKDFNAVTNDLNQNRIKNDLRRHVFLNIKQKEGEENIRINEIKENSIEKLKKPSENLRGKNTNFNCPTIETDDKKIKRFKVSPCSNREKLNVYSSKKFLSTSGNLEKSQHQGEETLNKRLTTKPEENNLETKLAQMEENIFDLMKKQKELIKELDSLKDLITCSFIDKNSEQIKKNEAKTDNKEIIPFGRTMINKQKKMEIESDLDDNQIQNTHVDKKNVGLLINSQKTDKEDFMDPFLKYDDYLNYLDGIWNSGQRVKILNDDYQLVERDFLSLKPEKCLNDNIINAYRILLFQYSKKDDFVIIGTYLYSQMIEHLQKNKYYLSENKIKQSWFKYAQNYKLIYLLQNLENKHWAFLAIDFEGKSITSFDSLYQDQIQYARIDSVILMLKFIYKNECEWTKNIGECPKQINAYDCGPMMLMQLEKEILNKTKFQIPNGSREMRVLIGIRLLAADLSIQLKE